MHADADPVLPIHRQLGRAVWRRRAPAIAAAALPWLLLWWPGVALWAAWLALDGTLWRRRIGTHWAGWLDADVSALEDSSALLTGTPASPIARLQQRRLQTRLASVLGPDDYRRIARRRAPLGLLALLLNGLAAGALWATMHADTVTQQARAAARAVAPVAAGDIVLKVTPPAYTGVAPFEAAPGELQVPQYSEVRWCFKRPAAAAPLVELGDGRALATAGECAHWRANESHIWRWRGGADAPASARYTLRVLADQAPQIAILAPTEMIQTLSKDGGGVELSVSVKDDYAVARASLHLTLARGSGENIRFSDRELPLPKSSDARVRHWKKRWTLAELGMEPGDELYFFVRASDNAPEHPHDAQSPTYTLRLPGPQSEALDSSALPSMVKPENLRSQRQIILDTEQLVADMKSASLSAATVRQRSEAIADDQAHLRRRYGQFLGEESTLFGDEHEHEHEEKRESKPGTMDVLHEFGHAHDQVDNATIFDPATKAVLRRALTAMWDAEKSLRAIAPSPALPHEHKALGAIKELQQAERIYLHRTAFVPPAISEDKRMTGDMVGALSYQRAQGAASAAVTEEARALVLALSGDGALPALWRKQAHDLIAARVGSDEQRLAAQRAVQDVADGCVTCRPALRAWLRGALGEAQLRIQATPFADSNFRRAWNPREVR